MKTYYHNTTSDNKDNMILGYATAEGDFLTAEELEIMPAICKIVVEEGLLSCGENYDDFCKRIAQIAVNQ